jgi:hypothetical protein
LPPQPVAVIITSRAAGTMAERIHPG